MNKKAGKLIRLFLADGTASGLITAELLNWTGHVLAGSRSHLSAFLNRDEPKKPGIYFLVGGDPDRPTVYIGQSENVQKRLKQHNSDTSKDFWERTCVITSNKITQAHTLYLESRLIEIAKQADSSNVSNRTSPNTTFLPEADQSDMEVFLDHVLLILPVLGLGFLKRINASNDSSEISENLEERPIFQLIRDKDGIKAKAKEIDGEFVVLEGSNAFDKWKNTSHAASYEILHSSLVSSGKLYIKDGFATFKKDVPFSSPSAAASVILARQANGRTEWKIDDITYGDWQEKKLAEIATEDDVK
ncbi:MAG: GIY-YIG nuclease family protein [Gammaproteobacteria bacterium]|nr:GIY-YIG nuclease family protein [Gammaproteobacteria bacterium]